MRLAVPPGCWPLSAATGCRIRGGSGTPEQRHERSLRLARRAAVHPPGKWGPEDVRETLQVFLMLRPILPEHACWADPSYRLPGPVARRIHIADHLFGRCLLLLARAED